MTTQTGNRSCRGRASLLLLAIGAMSLPMIGCAEIEVSAEAYKNLGGANAQPPRQPSVQPTGQPPVSLGESGSDPISVSFGKGSVAEEP